MTTHISSAAPNVPGSAKETTGCGFEFVRVSYEEIRRNSAVGLQELCGGRMRIQMGKAEQDKQAK